MPMYRQSKQLGASVPVTPRRLESAVNPEWKAVRKALAQGALFEGRYWIVETPRLLAEAVRSGLQVARVYAAEQQLQTLSAAHRELRETDWVEVSSRALEAAAAMESSQGVFALVERPRWERTAFFAKQRLLVVLDRVQDPGNAGAIARSAEAFGATGLVFLKGGASPDAPKVMRASAGSLFRLPFLQGLTAEELVGCLRGYQVYGASPEARTAIEDLEVRTPAALLIGNEGGGVSAVLERASLGFHIPTQSVESLNAAVSAGIALYVLGRAVRLKEGGR